MPRYGPPTIVRSVGVPTPPAPDATIANATAQPDGSVSFDISAPAGETMPLAVDYFYVPEGTLPDPIESVDQLSPLAAFSGQVAIDGPGPFAATPGSAEPGDYAVVLMPLFAD